MIEFNGRYSASKLMTVLPQPCQERPFKKLHSCHSPEFACRRHTDFSPVRTIIAYADSLPESPLNESISYLELPCFTIINMRTGGFVEQLLN